MNIGGKYTQVLIQFREWRAEEKVWGKIVGSLHMKVGDWRHVTSSIFMQKSSDDSFNVSCHSLLLGSNNPPLYIT